jgi:hypothetical protein
MPKETVYGQSMALAVEPGGAIIADPRTPVVEVRWHRESASVQVVSRIQEREIAGPGESLTCEYGMYVDLDRHGINHLIRNLRRARDQVFGRDE